MALENNICSNRVNVQADEHEHLYHVDGTPVSEEDEQMYLEF
jgi:hypothetical protein